MAISVIFSDVCHGPVMDVVLTAFLFVLGWFLTRPSTPLGRLFFASGQSEVAKAVVEDLDQDFDEEDLLDEPGLDQPAGVAHSTPKSAVESKSDAEQGPGSQQSLIDIYTSLGREEAKKAARADSMCSTTAPTSLGSSLYSMSDDDDFSAGQLTSFSDDSLSLWDQAMPEAAANDDADRALETAMASGNSDAADLALRAGLRHCGGAWAHAATEKLRAMGMVLKSARAAEIAAALGREGKADLALRLWQDEVADQGLDPREGMPEAELFSAVLEACASSGSFETAVEAMESCSWCCPTSFEGQRAVCSLARWLARRRDLGLAMRCYNGLSRAGGCADRATCKTLLLAAVHGSDMATATLLFEELGSCTDGALLSAMVCGHCGTGELPKAMKYFQSMRKAGMVPERSLFDALLGGCATGNLPSMLEQVLSDMENDGVAPSNATVSALVRHYGKRGDLDRALSTFEHVPQQHGLTLDARAYGSLVSVCLHQNRLDLALDAFQRLQEAGLRPHARTCDALIQACRAAGDLEQAVALVDAALQSGLRVEEATMEALLQLIGQRHKSAELGAPLVERLQRAGAHLPAAANKILSAVHEKPVQHAGLEARRATLQQWRNFVHE